MTRLLLMAAGALLVLGALTAAVLRLPRWALLLAIAGEAAVGCGGLTDGAWAVTVATWGMGAYLAFVWARLELKGRR